MDLNKVIKNNCQHSLYRRCKNTFYINMHQKLFSTAKTFVTFSKIITERGVTMLHFLKTMLQSLRKTYFCKFSLRIKRCTFA